MPVALPEYTRFRASLARELALAGQIREAQSLVRGAVKARTWTDFDALQDSMNRLGGELEALDRERVEEFSRLASCLGLPADSGDFYAVTSRLPGEERQEITALYRELKTAVMKIRFENESFLRLLSETGALIHDFLEAAFPDRKGKLYSRQGSVVNPDMGGMVLNHRM